MKPVNMFLLDENNVKEYLKDRNLNSQIKKSSPKVKRINSGLISNVFKVTYNEKTLFLKQATRANFNQLATKLKGLPEELKILYDIDRQFTEVKALKILEKYLPSFVPELYFYDEENHIIALSGLGNHSSKLLSEAFDKEINPKIIEKLATNIALISNRTYGKIQSLRNSDLENRIRKIIYKYEVGKVWDKIESKTQRIVLVKAKSFITESLKINKVLVHGDFQERNILVENDDCWTFDLEEAHIGDPVEDIGKLAASYILRIFFFDKIKNLVKNDAIFLIETFIKNLRIPEDITRLQNRLKVVIAGCLLLRIDGISSAWLKWEDDEKKKQKVRNFSLELLNNEKTITELIKRL